MAEVTYADNYEEITGKKIPQVETKVIAAPETPQVAPATVAEVG
jgi:hypothetical protein